MAGQLAVSVFTNPAILQTILAQVSVVPNSYAEFSDRARLIASTRGVCKATLLAVDDMVTGLSSRGMSPDWAVSLLPRLMPRLVNLRRIELPVAPYLLGAPLLASNSLLETLHLRIQPGYQHDPAMLVGPLPSLTRLCLSTATALNPEILSWIASATNLLDLRLTATLGSIPLSLLMPHLSPLLLHLHLDTVIIHNATLGTILANALPQLRSLGLYRPIVHAAPPQHFWQELLPQNAWLHLTSLNVLNVRRRTGGIASAISAHPPPNLKHLGIGLREIGVDFIDQTIFTISQANFPRLHHLILILEPWGLVAGEIPNSIPNLTPLLHSNWPLRSLDVLSRRDNETIPTLNERWPGILIRFLTPSNWAAVLRNTEHL